jgi:XTP/dITP diphosphohydrolase
MPIPKSLIIASSNSGKVREFRELLTIANLEVLPQPENLDVDETGSTFAENARIKASAVAKATGQWALADDSGLCVEALGGAPGVHSARYGNTDLARIERLLAELEAVNSTVQEIVKDTKYLAKRKAYFVSALAISDPSGTIRFQAEGRCNGNILKTPSGEEGFGYDPIFYVPELQKTFAEISMDLKHKYGHRGKAIRELIYQFNKAQSKDKTEGYIKTLYPSEE